MTPNEEYAHYAADEGQTPQGVPLRRHEPWTEIQQAALDALNNEGSVKADRVDAEWLADQIMRHLPPEETP